MQNKMFFLPSFFVSSCFHNDLQKSENLSTPVAQISPTLENKIERYDSQSIISEKVRNSFGLPNFNPHKEERKQYLKEFADLSKVSQIPILEKLKISKTDLEIRLWRVSSWWQMDIFILRRTNERWSASIQRQNFRDGTFRLKNISKRRLSEPNSGWEIVLQKLTEQEIFTLPDGFENGGSEPCPDCGGYTIETNRGGEYRFYVYTEPSLESNLRESRQVAKIVNLISDEFNLQDLKTLEALPFE